MTATSCLHCGAHFDALGSWQTLCRVCYAQSKKQQLQAIAAERDAALDQVRALRRELDQARLELARRPRERVLPADQWRRLLQLCHPDKHANSETATTITRWLLENRPL